MFCIISFDEYNLLILLEKLSDIQCQPESQLKFITEAWLQVNHVAADSYVLTLN